MSLACILFLSFGGTGRFLDDLAVHGGGMADSAGGTAWFVDVGQVEPTPRAGGVDSGVVTAQKEAVAVIAAAFLVEASDGVAHGRRHSTVWALCIVASGVQ